MAEAALRPMLPDDIPVLAAIFAESVMALAADDYSEPQQEAWAAQADEEGFASRLGAQLTLVATLEGVVVGFASLKGKDIIDMLYIHPDYAEQGVGTVLCDALEKLAAARGVAELNVEASDNSQGFFATRGYAPNQRNSRTINGEWLANTTMRKTFAKGSS
jgi:putative acetyltransferase